MVLWDIDSTEKLLVIDAGDVFGVTAELIVMAFVFVGALIASIVGTLRWPKPMYWIGFVGLYFQSLLLLFKFEDMASLFGAAPTEFSVACFVDGLEAVTSYGPAIILAVCPFPIPALLACFTSGVCENYIVGLAAFAFFSILQVVIHGVLCGQDRLTNKMLAGAKLAIPILSFLVNVLRAMAGS
jgi:hypothetical protein